MSGKGLCGVTSQSWKFLIQSDVNVCDDEVAKDLNEACLQPTMKHGRGSILISNNPQSSDVNIIELGRWEPE